MLICRNSSIRIFTINCINRSIVNCNIFVWTDSFTFIANSNYIQVSWFYCNVLQAFKACPVFAWHTISKNRNIGSDHKISVSLNSPGDFIDTDIATYFEITQRFNAFIRAGNLYIISFDSKIFCRINLICIGIFLVDSFDFINIFRYECICCRIIWSLSPGSTHTGDIILILTVNPGSSNAKSCFIDQNTLGHCFIGI